MAKKKSKLVIPEGSVVLAMDLAGGVGWSLGVGGKVITYGKHAMDTSDSMGERLHRFAVWLSKMIHKLPARPEIVVIEGAYLGRNVKTYSTLTKYAAVAQREIYRILNVEAQFITPRYVKQILKLPKTRSHAQAKKSMIRKINRLLGLELKYVPHRTKKSKLSDDDTSDALALLLAFWLKYGIIEDADDAVMI